MDIITFHLRPILTDKKALSYDECVYPWQSSGRIVISTRVLQNLNQFTLKNHDKLHKIDIWR